MSTLEKMELVAVLEDAKKQIEHLNRLLAINLPSTLDSISQIDTQISKLNSGKIEMEHSYLITNKELHNGLSGC